MNKKVCYISVIVPIYHGKKYIKPMIHQIENCARELDIACTVELLLVNDAPEDSIQDCYFSDLIEINILNTDDNRGIQGARIYGLEQAKGAYIVFLDQDDLIKPEYLMSQMDCIGEADACVCRAIHEGKQFYDSVKVFEQEISKEAMLAKGCGIVSPGQVLLRKSAVSEVWKQNLLKHNGADDWFLWLCMFGEGKRFVLNQEVLFEHVVDGTNTSWNSERMMQSEENVYHILRDAALFSNDELRILERTIGKVKSKHITILDKFKKQFFILDAWMNLENKGLTVEGYLKENGYDHVAIYGYGYIGKQLYGRLRRKHMDVVYIIDQSAKKFNHFIGRDILNHFVQSS